MDIFFPPKMETWTLEVELKTENVKGEKPHFPCVFDIPMLF